MVTEIEQDAASGARASDEATAFCAAVRAAGGAEQGPVDLAATSTSTSSSELLALELVGSRRTSSRRWARSSRPMTSITALATTAAVVQAQGPRFLRGPFGVLRRGVVGWRGASPGASGAGDSGGSEARWPSSIGAGRAGPHRARLVHVRRRRRVGATSAGCASCVAVVLGVLAAPWLLVGAGRQVGGPREIADPTRREEPWP